MIGVEDGTATVDDEVELEIDDEEVELEEDDGELELEASEEDAVAELEGIVEVLKEVIDGVVLRLEKLELLNATDEDVMTTALLEIRVADDDVELEPVVVVIRWTKPAIRVLRSCAVETKD
jgi:hypothetical protein